MPKNAEMETTLARMQIRGALVSKLKRDVKTLCRSFSDASHKEDVERAFTLDRGAR
jgi:hypothetical protein